MNIADMHKPTALVVNDDPLQLRLTAKVLSRDGFEVFSCLGAEEALRMLGERRSVDIVVTDLYMPGIDGWRFCRLLRSTSYQQFNTIPILIVSATFSGADAEELTAQLGADGFLPAPYDGADLCRMVRDLLGNTKVVKLTTLLIVGPHHAATEELAKTFATNGYKVSRASNGDDALQRFHAVRPQIVILDYDFAENLATRLIQRMKEPAAASVVIAMTADRSAELALSLIRWGVDNYVHKPVAAEYLLHLCETAARQRALLRVQELLELRTRRLRDSEERYRNLFENAGDGIVTHTLDGIILGVNRKLEALSHASRDDLLGKSLSRLMTGDSFADATTLQEQARQKKDSSWTYEMELACADGTVVPVEAHCCILSGTELQPSIIIAMYRDITTKKELERQRAEFTAMLAHDIRNPIGLILGCSELLLDAEKPLLDSSMIHKCHQRIREDARTIESLVGNYLDVSRIEAGQLRLSTRKVDLASILHSIVERYECEATARSIGLELTTQQVRAIDGDALALERVFANLLGNALKFTPDEGSIRISLESRGPEVVVSVRDSGPGIDAEKLPTLFQKFNRIEIGERQEGVGLGLYIVKELVNAHAGRVEAQSAVGQGSCFRVFLPTSKASSEPLDAADR